MLMLLLILLILLLLLLLLLLLFFFFFFFFFFLLPLLLLVAQMFPGGHPRADRITLVGHSLGGFLAGRYALSCPDTVDGLVLASPAGLAPPPPRTGHHHACLLEPEPTPPPPPGPLPPSLRLLEAAWSANVTPGQLFRAWSCLPSGLAGSGGGPRAVEVILRRRFGDRWPPAEVALVARYLYHLTVQPGSGEFAMNSLLRPAVYDPPPRSQPRASGWDGNGDGAVVAAAAAGEAAVGNAAGAAAGEGVKRERPRVHAGVFAREPLLARVGDLPKGAPLLILFGDRDWIRPPAGGAEAFVAGVRAVVGRSGPCTLATIPCAGHHLYLDNAPHFNATVNGLHKSGSSL